MDPVSTTEITLLGGERHLVEGEARTIERLLLGAARGSLMELAWLTDARSGEALGVNPEHVMLLRSPGSSDQPARSSEADPSG